MTVTTNPASVLLHHDPVLIRHAPGDGYLYELLVTPLLGIATVGEPGGQPARYAVTLLNWGKAMLWNPSYTTAGYVAEKMGVNDRVAAVAAEQLSNLAEHIRLQRG